MDKETQKALLEKNVRVYGGGVSGSIKDAIDMLEIIHGQSKVNNMSAVKVGLEIIQKRLLGILSDIAKCDEAKEQLEKLYNES